MTDSSVKAGVEDVLSSIKRLVSEEGRKVPNLIKATAARKPGRLVLTDALRVGTPAEDPKAPLKLAQKISAEAASQHAANVEAVRPANDLSQPMRLRSCDIVRPGTPAINDIGGESSDDREGRRDLAGSLSAKIAALEAAIARTEDQWEPDGESDDAYSGTRTDTVSWASDTGFSTSKDAAASEAEMDADSDEETTPATFIRDNRDASEAEVKLDQETPAMATGTMDEDELRELIADIVRQELQGALGERITRNIRKLVRREINRALAAQTLD
ncbi:hypothetical protein [Ruegeria arenilitoris]|uniref:hypothetical protein n=1 Tax=Ruegeria arenilitoris TaxID=1173585 RepID=UPI00147A8E71|nr:hypothetical protein [Ruegeria arenilitoris]